MTIEKQWKEVKGNLDTYLVSNYGEVLRKQRRLKNGKIREQYRVGLTVKENGYVVVDIPNNGHRKRYYLHRLVAMLFIPNPNNLPYINHIDGNKQNNRVDNLEWCTRSENEKHAWRIGLKTKENKGTKGERHGMHKLTQKQVDYIRSVHKPFDAEYGSVALAKKFGVTPQTITDIANYRSWKHSCEKITEIMGD